MASSIPTSRFAWAALAEDVRFAVRSLRRTPTFTAVAVGTLAFGLALVATTLAVVNAYLLRAMPFPAADRLYHVIYAPQGQPEPRGITEGLDWRQLADVVEVADSSIPARFYLREGAATRDAGGMRVARGSLEALGVQPILGQAFADRDFLPGGEPVALIGYEMWRSRFGGDRDAIGQRLPLGGASLNDPVESYRIVGVLPPNFHFAREYARGLVEIVAPLRTPQRAYFVRLRPGVPPAFAAQRLTEVVRRVSTSLPPDWRGVRLESLRARYTASLRPLLLIVSGGALLVLLIVGVNVAVLTLLRALRRQKEMAVRVALGAGRRELARLLLAEAALLCGTALLGALALTTAALRAFAPRIEAQLGRPAPGGPEMMQVDTTVALGIGAVATAVALALSFLPLLTLWNRGLADALRREGRSGTDRPSTRRLRSTLVALEVAISLALLVGGGLMVRTVINLVSADLGFTTEHIVRARIALLPAGYPEPATFARFHDRFAERMSALPGVSFALTNFIPFYPVPRQAVEIDGPTPPAARASVLAVSPGYFSTLQIELRQGRAFTADDRPGTEPVAIVSESLARRLWPDNQVLGRRLRTAEQPVANAPLTGWRTVVGVARDVRQTHTDTDFDEIYLPLAQAPNRYTPLFIRSMQPASYWAPMLNTIVGEIDPDVMVNGITTLRAEGDQLLAGPRFLTSVLAGFAGFAALLALLGIYGTTAYAVQQREREVAIRVALGATDAAVVRLFVRRGGLVLGAGLALGLLGALGVARGLAHQVHGIASFDPATMAASGGFIALVGFLATWWPARRAARRDPMILLKEE